MKRGDILICKNEYKNNDNLVSFEIGKSYTISGYNESNIVWIDSGSEHEYFSVSEILMYGNPTNYVFDIFYTPEEIRLLKLNSL